MGKKLEWVEVGRGIAAFVVLLSHAYVLDAAPPFLLFFGVWGKLGVAFFFILSGFIICYVHRSDVNRPDRAPNFAFRRFVRIFPTYLLILIVAIFIRQTLGNSDYRLALDASFLIRQFFLLDPAPFIDVAWTLRHEVLFYALFLIFIIDRRIGMLAFAIWFFAIILNADWREPCALITAGTSRCAVIGLSLPLLTAHLNLYFYVGAAIALALERGNIRAITFAFSATAALCLVADATFNSVYFFAAMQFFGCAAVVGSAVWLSKAGIRAPSFLIFLGTISYPLYLIHIPAYQIAHGLVKRLGFIPRPMWLPEITITVAITVFGAWFLVARIERPLFAAIVYSKRPVVAG
jgi:exopolysaccharide production protein ExoZ